MAIVRTLRICRFRFGIESHLTEQPALLLGFGHALDAQSQRGQPAAEFHDPHLVIHRSLGLVENRMEFGEYFIPSPVIVLIVLQPFEVGNDNPTGIA